ncbi:hypothetical protein AX16_010412 [Volvariella volvacea WC 439]|nr:hypothetical protein AX16_010412 [Volvariella volvacea WC 439]
MPQNFSNIPFGFFCSLLHQISQISPSQHKKSNENARLRVLDRWLAKLQNRFAPLPPHIPGTVLRLLFPEEDSHRVYELQEQRLAQYLFRVLSLEASSLTSWKSSSSSGCLGLEVEKAIQMSQPGIHTTSSCSVDIVAIDELLNELASFSRFSRLALQERYPRSTRRSREALLHCLYKNLSAREAAFMTQIVLKDLRPLLYPSSSIWPIISTNVSTYFLQPLTKEQVLRAWDPTCRLLSAYRLKSSFSDLKILEHISAQQQPQIGVPIEVPKAVKGRDCRHALSLFSQSDRVWVETKYDGERAQIHINVVQNSSPQITIFSKSKRDSTLDRYGIRDIILSALNLGGRASSSQRLIERNVVLEAEMVACRGNEIDEFWRIKALVECTTMGARARQISPTQDEDYSQSSMKTDASESGHLGLVFFDVLMIDSKSLLSAPYCERRKLLESLLEVSPGKIMLAQRSELDLGVSNEEDAIKQFQQIFSDRIANHEEGVILKCHASRYNDHGTPWVKLKKDYIPGYGDNLDLLIVGARWDKDRARELGVGPAVFTTMYIGSISSKEGMTVSSKRLFVHAYFTASYGLTRRELEKLNALLRSSDTIDYHDFLNSGGLSYDLTLLSTLAPPSIVLNVPILAEICGAGFTKAPRSKHYELRFPRIVKVYRAVDRAWTEAVDLRELYHIAREVVGRDRSLKDVDDWCNTLWGQPTSPSVKSTVKRKAAAEFWEKQLAALDQGGHQPKLTPNLRRRMLTPTKSIPLIRHQRRKENDANSSIPDNSQLMHTPLDDGRPLIPIHTVSTFARLYTPARALSSAVRNRAFVYSQNGNPSEVLTALSYPKLPPPAPQTLNLEFLLSPINPADLNVIEGVYPSKPQKNSELASTGKGSPESPVFIGGNEGLARVVEIGSAVSGFRVGDWVIMTKPQSGTWCSQANAKATDVLKLPRVAGVSEVQGATITVNPPTAYNMLHEFVDLQRGDWVIQNGANSAVGQNVIQIANSIGLRTINLIRDRPDVGNLAEYLRKLGATKVLTYEQLSDKSSRGLIESWLDGKEIRLGLNCVGGLENALMSRFLGKNAHLVSYGAMSKQPFSLPTSLFIFKNLTAHGFWQTEWYARRSRAQQEDLMKNLVNLLAEGKLREPEYEILSIDAHDADDVASNKVKTAIQQLSAGRYGKKVLLQIRNIE